MQKTTPWFPGSVNPVHPGVYQRQQGHSILYWRWNGQFWEMGGYCYAHNAIPSGVRSISQAYPWRGLANPPE